MAQAAISRRRPCRKCGGRYFANTVSVWAVLVALVAAGGGIWRAVVGSGMLAAVQSGGVPGDDSVGQGAVWAIGGILVAGIVLLIGRGYRCIGCDTQQ
jgi:hypothetical protein